MIFMVNVSLFLIAMKITIVSNLHKSWVIDSPAHPRAQETKMNNSFENTDEPALAKRFWNQCSINIFSHTRATTKKIQYGFVVWSKVWKKWLGLHLKINEKKIQIIWLSSNKNIGSFWSWIYVYVLLQLKHCTHT